MQVLGSTVGPSLASSAAGEVGAGADAEQGASLAAAAPVRATAKPTAGVERVDRGRCGRRARPPPAGRRVGEAVVHHGPHHGASEARAPGRPAGRPASACRRRRAGPRQSRQLACGPGRRARPGTPAAVDPAEEGVVVRVGVDPAVLGGARRPVSAPCIRQKAERGWVTQACSRLGVPLDVERLQRRCRLIGPPLACRRSVRARRTPGRRCASRPGRPRGRASRR